jgi:hypothetical protein
MARALSVEILDRLGRVRERVRIAELPAVIGRAYSCDVILDDRYVSPQHVRIDRDADGRLFVEDLESTNGTQRLAPYGALTRAPIDDDMRLRVGNSILRLRAADHAVEPAARLVASSLPAGLLGNRPLAVAACALVVAFFLLDDYLASFDHFSLARLISQTAAVLMLLALWGGLWSLVSRVTAPSFHFLEHCTIGALWALGIALCARLVDYYAFAFAADGSADVLRWVGLVPLLAGVLYSHLRLCSAMPPLRLALSTTAVSCAAVGLSGLVMLGAELEDEWPGELAFSRQLKPPAFQVAPSRGVDEFFNRAQALKEHVDHLLDE